MKTGLPQVRYARLRKLIPCTPFVPFTAEAKAIMTRVVGPPTGTSLRAPRESLGSCADVPVSQEEDAVRRFER